MNLLLIDDDSSYRELIKKYIAVKKPHITVYEAVNGLEALELIQSIKIDLVLLDLFMPQMDGLEFIELCNKEDIKLPFIIISGGLNGKKINTLYQKGAIDCIKKPFYLEELINKICRV